MTEHHTNHPRHETSDLSARAIGWVLTAVAVAILLAGAAVWWVYGYLREQDQLRDVRRTLVVPPSQVPPEPRLQVSPSDDLRAYKQEQEEILNSYEWISRDEGRVRIPIERAMDLLAQRGIQAAKQPKEKK